MIYVRGRFGDGTGVPPGMAVEFAGMTEKDAASLTSLVAGLLTGGIETDGADKVVSTGKSRAHKPEDQPDA